MKNKEREIINRNEKNNKLRVGNLLILALILVSVSSIAKAQNDFYMVVAADPQYPRFETKNEKKSNDKANSTLANLNQVANIKMLSSSLKGKVKGVIINGDLTEYGHSNELEAYKTMWSSSQLGNLPVYPGLGNHDYANNLGDCTPSCSNRMLKFMSNYVSNSVRYSSFDYNSRTKTGSLAYSWDVGQVRFIQLHNYPAFVVNNGNFNVKSSMDWLEKEMQEARRQGKAIILNLHDVEEHFEAKHLSQYNEFKKLVSKYKVSAVFAGHIHSSIGEIATWGNTPIIRAGSPMFFNYLLVHFNGNKMKIEKVRSKLAAFPVRNSLRTYTLQFPKENLTTTDRSAKANYKVRIKTSKIKGAGTDANIYISLTGTKGQTGEYLLDKSNNNDFEAGDDDTYLLWNIKDVGTIEGFQLRNDLSGLQYNWIVEKVTITKNNGNSTPTVIETEINKTLAKNTKVLYCFAYRRC